MHFIPRDPWTEATFPVEVTFKNRHTPGFMKASIEPVADAPGEYVVHSEERVQGIAPGQFAVIYSPDSRVCYGSGIITGRAVE